MNKFLADADLCVKCGLCLPHCPTYTKTQNENESPRGRIALIQAWAGHHLDATENMIGHIDICLLCRSCEKVCPAVVPYSRLIDNFRERLYAESRSSLALFLLKKISHNKTINRLSQYGLSLYKAGRLQKMARLFKLPQLLRLDKIERLLPDVAHLNLTQQPLRQYYAASGEAKGTVGLFVGCMGLLLDHETVNAAIKLLTAVGFNVSLPKQQTCCGALDLHDGDRKTADQLEKINCTAFAELDLDAIVTVASGCGGQLKEYKHSDFSNKVVDISQFLSQSGGNLSERLKPLAVSVCLHTPCSLKNVMCEAQGALKLLQQLPGINIRALPEAVQCCGSAGSYMLKHPKMAQALLDDLLEVVLEAPPGYLVTTNIGCALHIAAGLREQGIQLEVIHPIVLVARQLEG